MSARSCCAILCCCASFLAGCVYSGAATIDAPGFSASHFRYQMQAQQQAVAVRKQREIAAAVAAQQAANEQAAGAAAQPVEVAENLSLWERLKLRFR